ASEGRSSLAAGSLTTTSRAPWFPSSLETKQVCSRRDPGSGDIFLDLAIHGPEGGPKLERCRRSVGSQQRSQKSVVERGVEDRHAGSIRGDGVGMGAWETANQALEPETAE